MSTEPNPQTLADFIRQHAPGHRYGTKALHELVEGIKRTGKGGSVSFTIKLVPDPKRSHALLVSDAVVAKVPQLDPPQRLTWLLPSGQIVDHDPNQLPLPIDDPAMVRTSMTTIETGGGIFTADGPDEGEGDDLSLPGHTAEHAARVLQFAEAAFSTTPPPGAIDDDEGADEEPDPYDADEPASGNEPADDVAQQLVDDGLLEVVEGGLTSDDGKLDDEPRPGDDLPMLDDIKADDMETATGQALADAAAAAKAAPDNVTAITKTRAPRKSRAKVTASAT